MILEASHSRWVCFYQNFYLWTPAKIRLHINPSLLQQESSGVTVTNLTVKMLYCSFTSIFKRFYLFIFRQKWREGEREKSINVWLPLMRPLLGTLPTTQECALIGNQTSDPLVCRPSLNPLSHTSQSIILLFYFFNCSSTCLVSTGKSNTKYV